MFSLSTCCMANQDVTKEEGCVKRTPTPNNLKVEEYSSIRIREYNEQIKITEGSMKRRSQAEITDPEPTGARGHTTHNKDKLAKGRPQGAASKNRRAEDNKPEINP